MKPSNSANTRRKNHSRELVPGREFERVIQQLIESLLKRVSGQSLALFDVSSQSACRQDAEKPELGGSNSGGLERLIETVAQDSTRNVWASPTVHSMRALRIQNIVLVDGFIDSGKRVTDFWESKTRKPVRSWVSCGWTTVWLVAYCGSSRALRDVVWAIPSIRIETAIPSVDD